METSDPQLPLAEPGTKAAPPASRRSLSPVMLAGAAGALLVIGAIGGMYIQGPVVRAFFTLTGLEPGGGAVRSPMAVSPPPSTEEPVAAAAVVALGRLQPVGSVIEVAGPTTVRKANVPVIMTGERAVLVLVGTLVACTVSGMLAIRRLKAADPADLF